MTRQLCFLTSVALAAAVAATGANAAIVPLSSGVSHDDQDFSGVLVQTVTGITTPGGKDFTNLMTPNYSTLFAAGGRTSGSGWDGDFNPPLEGAGGDLIANSIIIGNGYGYIDLLQWDGNAVVEAVDSDPSQQDFMIMDHIGNDNFYIAPILEDGTVGQRTDFRASDFGQQPGLHPLGNQNFLAGMIAFDITDLRNELGRNLPADAKIRGLRVYENTLIPPSGGGGNGLDLIMVVGDLKASIPEPTTALLASVALAAAAGARRR